MSINLLEINLVDLLNTGIAGFAVALLFLGFNLTSKVQIKILNTKPNEFENIEMFKEWREMFHTQLKNTRYFMLIAVVFFAGGLFHMIYDAESRIIIEVSPVEKGTEPIVRHQSKNIPLGKNGIMEIFVKDEHNIVISNDIMAKKLYDLKLIVEQKQNIAKELLSKEANKSINAGFGL